MSQRRNATLSEMDGDDLDLVAHDRVGGWDHTRSPGGAPSTRGGSKQNLRTLGGGGKGCWCGERYSHDWPGKDQGQPHPR